MGKNMLIGRVLILKMKIVIGMIQLPTCTKIIEWMERSYQDVLHQRDLTFL